jgi:chromosomal replication initiator protein
MIRHGGSVPSAVSRETPDPLANNPSHHKRQTGYYGPATVRSAVSELEKIWDDIKRFVANNIPESEYHAWFARVKALTLQDGTLVLGVMNSFVGEWMKNHYNSVIEDGMRSLGATSPRVEFRVIPSTQEALLLPEPSRDKDPATPNRDHDNGRGKLNPKYTFENFVVGPNNNLAHAAALAAAETPGRAYNPLFIYGDVGLGKTHLMHAVGHSVAERFPDKRIEYISTETFTNDLINSIREDRMTSFKDRYRGVDVLMVDDIQFIAGKERTQDEFFHTFNALYEQGKQIILSSDRPPRDILTLESRLRSRFEWGLITDIQTPQLETRIAILRMNSEYRQTILPNETLEYIARQITSNIRELEGALMRVIAYASLNGLEGDEITRNIAAKALSNVFSNPTPVNLSMNDILLGTASHFGLNPEQLRGQGRARDVVIPRQLAMFLCRELTAHSLSEVGGFFGRDHSTVLYATQKVHELAEQDPKIAGALQEIRLRLG